MKRAVKLDELWERAEHQEKEQRKASKPAKATAETKRLLVERQVPFTIEALTKKSRGTETGGASLSTFQITFSKHGGRSYLPSAWNCCYLTRKSAHWCARNWRNLCHMVRQCSYKKGQTDLTVGIVSLMHHPGRALRGTWR